MVLRQLLKSIKKTSLETTSNHEAGAPEAVHSLHDTPAASAPPTLRAVARTFTPGQGVRDEDASLPPPTAMTVAPEVLPPSGPDAAWPSTGEVAPGQDHARHGRVEASASPPWTYVDATVDGAVAMGVALPWAEPCTQPWAQPCTQPCTQPWVSAALGGVVGAAMGGAVGAAGG